MLGKCGFCCADLFLVSAVEMTKHAFDSWEQERQKQFHDFNGMLNQVLAKYIKQ